MKSGAILALAATFFAATLVVGTSDEAGNDPLPEILLIITAAITIALFVRQGRLKSEEVDEPVFSARFMHLCPQCGHRMKLRRDSERLFWYACPNCGLGMRNPDQAAKG